VKEEINFTPGPTQLYKPEPMWIKEIVDNGLITCSHRSQKVCSAIEKTTDLLKDFLEIPSSWKALYLSSATQSMEVLLAGCVEKTSLHFVQGAFAKRFYQVAKGLGKEAHIVNYESLKNIDLQSIDCNPELVAITLNETSTGVYFPYDQLKAIREYFPNSLIVLDVVSAVPFYNIDTSLCDAAFFSVQKGFGMPAGLGVLLCSPKIIEKASLLEGKVAQSYHSITRLSKMIDEYQTPSTPCIMLIQLLGKVTKYLLDKGRDTIHKETIEKSILMEKELCSNEDISLSITDCNWRSKTVLVVNTPHAAYLYKELERFGIIVGSGYADKKESQLRIANFPMHTLNNAENLCKAVKEISFMLPKI
jgi:phosphoserine aminotransferase